MRLTLFSLQHKGVYTSKGVPHWHGTTCGSYNHNGPIVRSVQWQDGIPGGAVKTVCVALLCVCLSVCRIDTGLLTEIQHTEHDRTLRVGQNVSQSAYARISKKRFQRRRGRPTGTLLTPVGCWSSLTKKSHKRRKN